MAKAFGCVYHNKLWKILKEMGIPDCLNLPPEKPVCRTRSNSYNWTWNNGLVQIGKGVHQCCILSPCLFNLYVEYIMWNSGLDEAQAGIKIAGRSSNNLWYADATTLIAESKGELQSLLMNMKEEGAKAGLKFSIQKMEDMASGHIISWQIDGEKWKQWQILFSWAPKSLWMVTATTKLKDACFLEEKLWQT